MILALQGGLCGQVLHTSCVLGVCSCWLGSRAMSPAAGSGERAGKERQQCLNDGTVRLGYCSRVLQQTWPSFRRRLASWTCCDASWTICTSACCSTTAAWAAASPRRRERALMRFPTQIPSPRVLFSRFDCPIWVVAFFFLSMENPGNSGDFTKTIMSTSTPPAES